MEILQVGDGILAGQGGERGEYTGDMGARGPHIKSKCP